MPSREVVEVAAAVASEDANAFAFQSITTSNEASPSSAPVQSSVQVDNDKHKNATTTTEVDGHNITPAPSTGKKDNAKKKKLKQQATLASFFGARKLPSTPAAVRTVAAATTKKSNSNTVTVDAAIKPNAKETKEVTSKEQQPATEIVANESTAKKKATVGKKEINDPSDSPNAMTSNKTAKTFTPKKSAKKTIDTNVTKTTPDHKPLHKSASITQKKPTESPPVTDDNESAVGSSTATTSSSNHSKMDFKHVIVGMATKSKSKQAAPSPSSFSTTDISNKSNNSTEDMKEEEADSDLPLIPPASLVVPNPSQAQTADENDNDSGSEHVTNILSTRDELKQRSIEIGGVKSQLVRIFENPPPTDAADGAAVVEESTDEMNADEVQIVEKVAVQDQTERNTKEDDTELPRSDSVNQEDTRNADADAEVQDSKLEDAKDDKAQPEAVDVASTEATEKSSRPAIRVDSMEEAKSLEDSIENADVQISNSNNNSNSESKEVEETDLEGSRVPSEATVAGAATDDQNLKTKEAPYPIKVGALFQKKFGKFGSFKGEVTKLPCGAQKFYRVIYTDGDQEELTRKQLNRLLNTIGSKNLRDSNPTSVLEDLANNKTTVATFIDQEAGMPTKVDMPTVASTDISKFLAPGKNPTPSKKPTSKPAQSVEPLDPDMQALLKKHLRMQKSHLAKAKSMVEQGRDNLDASDDVLVAMPSTENVEIPEQDGQESLQEFPDVAVPHLLTLLEGSKLPLSVLAKSSAETLNKAFRGASFSVDTVAAKIKVLSQRKSYIKNPAIAKGSSVSNNMGKDVNPFEDVDADHIWRWEVVTLDLLPEEAINKVKAARSARRKLQLQFNATARMLAALDESVKMLQSSKTKPTQAQVDKVISKVSQEEEKVLKFEQDAEKARLAIEVNKLKKVQTQQAIAEIQEKKKAADMEKKRAAELRQQEKEEAKQKKALEKEEAKRQKEAKARAEAAKKAQDEEKQRKRMLSFFGGPPKKQKRCAAAATTEPEMTAATKPLALRVVSAKDFFDSDKFQTNFNSLETSDDMSIVFTKLSKRAIATRRRRTKRVNMRVFVSGQNDDPFAAQPAFAEERIVTIRNRNKFLKFAEDCRPPYHGTWSKPVNKRLGRNPFLKDTALDYDVDSEAEWDEGDDDPGEDVEDDADDDEDDKLADEEGDPRAYNYQDGWLAQDDEIGDDASLDEDDQNLLAARKRKKQVDLVPVCIVAPAFGGIPVVDEDGHADPEMIAEKIDGFPVEEGLGLLRSHTGSVLAEPDILLDAFPPSLVDEKEGSSEPSATVTTSEPSEEDLRTVAKFVHHSTFLSKSMVVEELRKNHPTVTASRAQGQRVLDSIAEKKRHPKNGVYWEVKQDAINKLGLSDDLMPMEHSAPVEDPKKKDGAKKKRKSSNASENTAKKAKTPPKDTSEDKSSGSPKRKQTPTPSAKSVNLLKSFLAKKK